MSDENPAKFDGEQAALACVAAVVAGRDRLAAERARDIARIRLEHCEAAVHAAVVNETRAHRDLLSLLNRNAETLYERSGRDSI